MKSTSMHGRESYSKRNEVDEAMPVWSDFKTKHTNTSL
jgi:hypothetical protein